MNVVVVLDIVNVDIVVALVLVYAGDGVNIVNIVKVVVVVVVNAVNVVNIIVVNVVELC